MGGLELGSAEPTEDEELLSGIPFCDLRFDPNADESEAEQGEQNADENEEEEEKDIQNDGLRGARAFVKESVKDVAAWDLLVHKEYLTLQERLRCDAFHAPDDVAQISKPLVLPLPLSAVAECCEDEPATTSVPLFVGLAARLNPELQLGLADAIPFGTIEPEPENDGLGVPSVAPNCAVGETVLPDGSIRGGGSGGEVVASHVQVAPGMQGLSVESQSGDSRPQAVTSMKEVVVPPQVQQGAGSMQEVATPASACAPAELVRGRDGTTREQSGLVMVGLKRAVALSAAQGAKKYRAREKEEGK